MNRKIFSWVLIDWAHSAYSTTVMAVFFPLFFKDYWAKTLSVEHSTFYLGLMNSLIGVVVLFMAPFIGAFADKNQKRIQLLLIFTLLGAISSVCFIFVPESSYQLSLVIAFLGNLGFSGCIIFYDALLPIISPKNRYDFISSLGYAVGYVGGGILFVINITMFMYPEFWGFPNPESGVKYSFVSVGIWWLIFTLPAIFLIKEKQLTLKSNRYHSSFRKVVSTIKRIYHNKTLLYFFIAYWLYIDGVDTIIKMAMDYGKSIGLENNGLITAFLMVQFIAAPGTMLTAYLSKKTGPKKTINFCIIVYLIVVGYAFIMRQTYEFFILAFLIGLVQGGVQSLSRSIFSRLLPKEESAEYFGIYNIIGKFAVVFGPVLIGVTGLIFKSSRIGILSVSILFITGLYFLNKIEIKE